MIRIVKATEMFSRVVSNFRKKTKSSRSFLKSSIAGNKISPRKNESLRKISAEFDSDEALSATLSVYDSDDGERQHERGLFNYDKRLESDSGAYNSVVHKSIIKSDEIF